jgi:hypothetical protein
MKTEEYKPTEDEWSLHVISVYEYPTYLPQWEWCRECGARPKIWTFDNGRHAKCLCFEPFGESVRAESIMSHYLRERNTATYDTDGLKKAWNNYALTGKLERLPEGQW